MTTVMTHREALQQIMRICYESSEYSRRVQHIHDVAMTAIGLTKSQRDERHIKAAMRAEAYKESTRVIGRSKAKKEFVQQVEEESGETRMKFKSIIEGRLA